MTRSGNFFVAILGLLMVSAGGAGDMKKADEAFDAARFEEALREYAPLAETAEGDAKWRATYRAVESEALLFRYAEAAQRLQALKPPSDPLWRMRFLILRTEIAREYLQQYGYTLPKDAEEGSTEVTRRTQSEWHSEIASGYRALPEVKGAAIERALSKEEYFVELKGADTETTPTLWDFAIGRWTDYLLHHASGDIEKTAAEVFIEEELSTSLDTKAPALLAGALLEATARDETGDRQTARELFKLQRVLIPFKAPALVKPFSDDKKSLKAAAALLTRWMDGFKTDRARAEAGVEAATLLSKAESFADAVALCLETEKNWSKQPAADRCKQLRGSIVTPRLTLRSRPVPPGKAAELKTEARNIDKLYLSIYPTTPDELKDWYGGRAMQDWSHLRTLDDSAVPKLTERKPLHSSQTEVKYEYPHAHAKLSVPLPPLEKGLYVVIVGNEAGFPARKTFLQAAIVNVTDLVLFGESGLEKDPGIEAPVSREETAFHVFALNGKTGVPVAGADLDVLYRKNWNQVTRLNAKSDANGLARFKGNLGKRNPSSTLDALVAANGSLAYFASPLYFSHYFPPPIEVRIETDRPIYRPGQTAHVKATVIRRTQEGWEPYRDKAVLTLTARDAGGQEFFKKTIPLNKMGSGAVKIAIPSGRLLGQYAIGGELYYRPGRAYGYASIAVEEYKRPEFEVTLNEAASAWKYGKAAKIEGNTKYYFGGAVPDAKIRYRIRRQTFIPWFCWWWSWRGFDQGEKEVASGELKSSSAGEFSFSFTPQAADPDAKTPLPARFIVEIDGRDAGGRTIQATKTFAAGTSGLLFDVKMPGAFVRADARAQIVLRGLNLNEQPVSAKGSFAIHRINDKPKPPPESATEEEVVPSLQSMYEQSDDGKRVASGDFSVTPEKASQLAVPVLDPGVYRLKIAAKDPWGEPVSQSVIFLALDKKKKKVALPLPQLSLVEHGDYWIGERALVALGSADITQKLFVQYWNGPYLERTEQLDGGIHLIEVPVEKKNRGGLTLRWFGVSDFKVRRGEVRINVPWKDKAIQLAWTAPKTAEPSTSQKWDLTVKDFQGKAIDGEATIRVYDRSLEYYAKNSGSWTASLFGPKAAPAVLSASLFSLHGTSVQPDSDWIEKLFQLRPRVRKANQSPPALRSTKGRTHYGYYGNFGGGAMRAMAPASARKSLHADAAPEAEMSRAKEAKDDEGGAPAEARAQPAVRSEFAETALFEPQLQVLGGRAKIQFRFPDQLTSWRATATVVTDQLESGVVQGEIATRKDVMVRLEIPRFFREGDSGTVKAIVHNETNLPITGRVTLAVSSEDKPAQALLSIVDLERPFKTQAHGTAEIAWPAVISNGLRTFKVRAVARSGEKSDAEEREFPVFPSRERLIDSRVIALDGNQTQRIEPPVLGNGDKIESATLQVDPQILLPIMNSLPLLVNYPYECTEHVLNRFVPLAVLNEIFKKHPLVAEAVKKIPTRKTITPEWDRKDPRRLASLIETPWESQSKGMSSGRNEVVNLFDDKTVAAEQDASLKQLASYQLSSGAFPWFPGGRDDLYMTLYVIAELGEARDFGVRVPEDMMRKAFEYVVGEMERHKKDDEGSVSFLLYASYALTAWWEFGWAKTNHTLVKGWLDYADTHSRAMTAFGKAHAAHAYRQLGEIEKSDGYIDRALDGSKEDPIVGVYWAPEKISWIWYNDTVEKHAFLLRTLVKFRPADKKVPGLVKWLLFNRKGNEWKSTKATAAAIYSLIDFMKMRGALTKSETFQVEWTNIKEKLVIGPTDWLKSPLRWRKPASTSATVQKTGPGIAYASLTTIFSSDNPPKPPPGNLMDLERKTFLREKDGSGYRLKPLADGATVRVGDQVEIQLHFRTRSQFEYVHLKAPKAAGFEAEELRSGWKWEQLSRYEEPRDSLTNFFMNWVPHGEYVLNYRLRAVTPGKYRFGSAVAQSMYAPEMAAYSGGMKIVVTE